MSGFLERIQERAAAHPRRIAFSETDDARVADAIAQLTKRGLVEPLVVTDPEKDARFEQYVETFFTLRKHKGTSYDGARAIMRDPLYFAAMMVRYGDADGTVSGAVRTTADVLRAAILCVGAAPGITSVSSAFYMIVPDWPEVLTFTDASVIPEPTAEQLADIAEGAAAARAKIVGDDARIAFLSFSTYGSAEAASSLKVRAAAELLRQRRPDIVADGELQADAALIEAIARRKAPGSRIAGHANILVFPNLDAGNIGYKLVQRLARAEAIGPILQGLAKPCNDLSRGASAGDILNVACITALQAAVSTEQNLPLAGSEVTN
jgi:phosphate acetyltransferase